MPGLLLEFGAPRVTGLGSFRLRSLDVECSRCSVGNVRAWGLDPPGVTAVQSH